MIFNYLGLFLPLLATSSSVVVVSANNGNANRHRPVITPNDSIAQAVRDAGNNGSTTNNGKAKLKLQGAKSGGGGGKFEINVRESTPAITMATSISLNGGTKSYVNEDDMATILVSDLDDDEEVDDGSVAIIAVDKKTDDVNGIIDKGGAKMKFTQKKGKKAWAHDAPEWTSPPWSCGSEDIASEEQISRHLLEDDHHGHHHHHHHHEHDDTDPLDLTEITQGLRGSSMRQQGKRRKLQEASGGYTYQVDIYMEIDFELCSKNGEDCLDGPGPLTMNYINLLFAGANNIYESEIDTHLNLLHIDVNSNYSNPQVVGTAAEALFRMRDIYGSYGDTSQWHFPGADLQHALLGRNLGGGVAWKGFICSPDLGYGVSSGIEGTFQSMDSWVIWDMMVFMHELGHNFNAGHTHEGYGVQVSNSCGLQNLPKHNMIIDTCGCSFSNQPQCSAWPQGSNSCPSTLPLEGAATIMVRDLFFFLISASIMIFVSNSSPSSLFKLTQSYCHLCWGGLYNTAYTFGGKPITGGDRSSPYGYTNSPLNGNVSTEPRQVNAAMYSHVSSRTCTSTCPSDNCLNRCFGQYGGWLGSDGSIANSDAYYCAKGC
ncbi:hypothetical protein ACHAXR_005066, partial [Thalassiosira sp. AJA248-18]